MRALLAWALLLVGCTSPAVPDAALRDCAPTGTGAERRCPDGCRVYEGGVIDASRGCVTTERRVVACYAEMSAGNGEPECFERADDPSERVYTGSSAGVADGMRDLFAGWRPCPGVVVADLLLCDAG